VDDDFATLYPDHSNAWLAQRFGVDIRVVKAMATRLGLKKDPDYRRQVQSANARKRRVTPEQRAVLSQGARGRRVSPEAIAKALRTKRERGTLLKGYKHPLWKGGRPWRRFKDPRYIAWRSAVLERDLYRCQKCGRQCKKYERGLAAHHVKSYAAHPDLRYDVDNGVTLCRECHMALHGHPLPPPVPVACACGCGTLIPSRDAYGRPRRFVNHHGKRGTNMSHESRARLSRDRRGSTLSPQHRQRISVGLRNSLKRIGRPPKNATREDAPPAS